jgi:membrane protease subunit (stomatin/prohibitin family)
MGMKNFIKKQFIDIIQCIEQGDEYIAWRFPMMDSEIQNGASLTVRESQMAVFVNEGKIADIFGPGIYKLTTQTLPVLTYLKNWDKLFESPFKSDVYFFSTRERLDRKWGTSNPITIREKEFGAVRLRAFGIYSYHLVAPKLFYEKLSGTVGHYATEKLDSQLRNIVVSRLADLFGGTEVDFLDMAANQEKFGKSLAEKMSPTFAGYGLSLDQFVVQNISLPEELEKVLDARISMNVIGDMGRYTQYQVATSIPLAAQNEGGVAGAGAGLGAGLGMGMAMVHGVAPTIQFGKSDSNSAVPTAPPDSLIVLIPDEVVSTLEKLHTLVGKGVLSQEEFDTKKEELLKKIV